MFWLRPGWGLFGGGLAFMFGFGLLKLALWAGLIALIVLAVRSRREYYPHQPAAPTALNVLKTRYARGEISKAEYEEMRRTIES